jgi:hypothetical protein
LEEILTIFYSSIVFSTLCWGCYERHHLTCDHPMDDAQ